ncbi:hypothetical protein SALBM217S_04905 [Streptomyces griseoloalbus]
MATEYTDELMDEMGKLQEQLDHANAWDLDAQLEQAMDALGCCRPATGPSPTCPVVRSAASRCASSCWSSPTCCCSTSPPTTSTPSR